MVKLGFLRLGSPDSTTSTICLSCFRLVTQSGTLADLAAAERDHVCSLFDLASLHPAPQVDRRRQKSGQLLLQ
jgi:hypothetical protein